MSGLLCHSGAGSGGASKNAHIKERLQLYNRGADRNVKSQETLRKAFKI